MRDPDWGGEAYRRYVEMKMEEDAGNLSRLSDTAYKTIFRPLFLKMTNELRADYPPPGEHGE